MSSLNVFVCGATGTQGGALIENLVNNSIQPTNIHAITRDIDSNISRKLLSSAINLTKGNFSDEESFKKGISGCTTLFLNLIPNHKYPTEELQQAQRALSIAKESSVQHVIYTSILGATNTHRMPYLGPNGILGKVISIKEAIENEVRQAGFQRWTILRPGNFMSNYFDPVVRMYQGLVETGIFTTALSRKTVIHMVDPNDIGKIAAAASLDPVKFDRKEIEIMSEVKHLEEVMRDLSDATGRYLKADFLSEDELQGKISQNPLLRAQLALRDMPQLVEREQVESWGVELGTFDQFLQREKLRVERTYL